MIVHTKESLIRDKLSLSIPIKCNCGMFHMRNKPTADWLGQRGGRGDHPLPRRIFLLVFVLHVFAWHCAGRARWCLGASFSVFPLMARFVFLLFVERALDA